MKTVPEILRDCAATFEERNMLYGENYKHFGTLMTGMFPNGLTLSTADDWNRLGLLMNTAAKLTRYAQQFANGGHMDSIHDTVVYAAMLQEVTEACYESPENTWKATEKELPF